MLAIVLAVQVWFGTYSVLDVGKPGVPHLTARQAHWLDLIRKSPGYSKRWPHLRFTRQMPSLYRSVPPLIVFDVDEWTPAIIGLSPFHVIGEDCNAYYEIRDRGYYGPSSASCEGPPHFPAVPGEESVLGPPPSQR